MLDTSFTTSTLTSTNLFDSNKNSISTITLPSPFLNAYSFTLQPNTGLDIAVGNAIGDKDFRTSGEINFVSYHNSTSTPMTIACGINNNGYILGFNVDTVGLQERFTQQLMHKARPQSNADAYAVIKSENMYDRNLPAVRLNSTSQLYSMYFADHADGGFMDKTLICSPGKTYPLNGFPSHIALSGSNVNVKLHGANGSVSHKLNGGKGVVVDNRDKKYTHATVTSGYDMTYWILLILIVVAIVYLCCRKRQY